MSPDVFVTGVELDPNRVDMASSEPRVGGRFEMEVHYSDDIWTVDEASLVRSLSCTVRGS